MRRFLVARERWFRSTVSCAAVLAPYHPHRPGMSPDRRRESRMAGMGARRVLGVLGVVVVLAASGPASAGTGPASPSHQASAKRWTCPTARFRLKTLANHQKPHFEEKISRVEAALAAGNLSAAQLRNGQRFLANLHTRVDKINARMSTLAAKIASCGQHSCPPSPEQEQ